jgi:hypothetical protein
MKKRGDSGAGLSGIEVGSPEDGVTPIEEWFDARIREKKRRSSGEGELFWEEVARRFSKQDKIAMRAYLEEFGEAPSLQEQSRRDLIVQKFAATLDPPGYTRTREVKALRGDLFALRDKPELLQEHYPNRQRDTNLSDRPWRKSLSTQVEYVG